MKTEKEVKEMMSGFMDNIKKLVDVDTVIGTPFETKDGTLLVPITKVSVGFVSGGGEYGADKKIIKMMESMPFAGGGAGGLTINPVGFLEIKKGNCKLLRLNEKSVYQNILDKLPGVIDSVSSIIKKEDKSEK